ncbi:cyclic nucleotide-binding domain-containing protein [Chryseobacterium sp. ISL-6]|uniref:cyclic nucleotide-binding domain-containing protein n=1 Tax=Chryseobacterium sp. ISL-6 TaxID=2819143 RepID=UPI001BEC105D|nr:cyclic nucleotide-binding domain-containing protein [Chryseobacterium sp. ISL-6]MBT2623504.1 hypothetical protein [Chryseobacterium sp. ISL-6]
MPGTVELNNYHEDGKEFTLNILSDGQSVGKSLLFSDHNIQWMQLPRHHAGY